MRSSLLALVALTACSRGPVIDLPVCAGGVPIDASALHSMTVDSRGGVAVNGVACSDEREVERALGTIVAGMRVDPADVARSGWKCVSDPLLVRIDRRTPWVEAARRLAYSSIREQSIYRDYVYRKWIAVRDARTGLERCVRIEYLPIHHAEYATTSAMWRESNRHLEPQVTFLIWARDDPWPADHLDTDSSWHVMHWPDADHVEESDVSGWTAIHELITKTPPSQRDFVVEGVIRGDMAWADVLPLIVDALELSQGRLEIGFRQMAPLRNR